MEFIMSVRSIIILISFLFLNNLFAQEENIGAIGLNLKSANNIDSSIQILKVIYKSKSSNQIFENSINDSIGYRRLFELLPDEYVVNIVSNKYREIEIKNVIVLTQNVTFISIALKKKRNKKYSRKIKIKMKTDGYYCG